VPITWWSQLIWLFALALGSFLVTWIFTDLLRFARTAYIGVLTVVTAGFLFGYLSWSNADWGAFISYQWFWGLVGAVITGPLLVAIMVQGARRAHSRVLALTPRPEGLHLAATLLWEGVVYGIDEGLLLSVLPVLMTWQALSVLGWTQSWLGVVFSGAVALVASVFVIVVHHLGYQEFRGPAVAGAAISCSILSLAYLLTMNPLAAMGGHIIAHSGVVLLGRELPPPQEERVQTAASTLPAH
jgi:hypothetical protein